jgi:hypothetical protein
VLGHGEVTIRSSERRNPPGQLVGVPVSDGSGGTGTVPVPVSVVGAVGVGEVPPGVGADGVVVGRPGADVVGADGDEGVVVLVRVDRRVVVAAVVRVIGVVCSTWPDPLPAVPASDVVPTWAEGGRT